MVIPTFMNVLRISRYALTLVIATSACSTIDKFTNKSQIAINHLETALQQEVTDWQALSESDFATVPLSRKDAEQATHLLGEAYKSQVRTERQTEVDAQTLKHGELSMRFFTKVYGEAPQGGRSLFISMHGGGNAPARVNDRQWENQKSLYEPEEGVYVAPRAPTDTWNLWHQDHVDWFFERLIQNMIVFYEVNPNRVYLMGYSAGGDGVYQLAPRMADYFGAAAMMAGHPNETSPLGLRNLPFALFMGGKDAAYKRNEVAAEWKIKLAELQEKDPDGYVHWVKIFPDHAHWMQKEDAAGVPWMQQYNRRQYPNRIVWKQDDVWHDRFYWLKVPERSQTDRAEAIVSFDQQTFHIEKAETSKLTILLNDAMVCLDEPIRVVKGESVLFEGRTTRTIQNLIESLLERGDPTYMFSSTIELDLDEME